MKRSRKSEIFSCCARHVSEATRWPGTGECEDCVRADAEQEKVKSRRQSWWRNAGNAVKTQNEMLVTRIKGVKAQTHEGLWPPEGYPMTLTDEDLRKATETRDAEISRLREALEPFAKADERYDDNFSHRSCTADYIDGVLGKIGLKRGDLRRAREALNRGKDTNG